MTVKTQEEMFAFVQTLGTPKLYKKFAIVEARKATIGEHIVTEINGVVETTNTVKEPSVVVKGMIGEEYIININKFNKLYETSEKELTESYQPFQAKGEIYAVSYVGEDMEFIAPWGEKMLVCEGDMLNTKEGDIYRIEKTAFAKTYKLKEEV